MRPELLTLSGLGLTIHSYHAMLALAVVVCSWLGPRWAERLAGMERRRTRWALLVLGLAAFAGGRVHYVASHWRAFADQPIATLAAWSGGLHAGGAIIALALVLPVMSRRLCVPAARFADALAPTIGIGVAIARLGCLLEGCCFGAACEWPWCVPFPRPAYAFAHHDALHLLPLGTDVSLPVHLLQLYFAAAGLLLTLVAFAVHRRRRYDGEVALVVLLVHSLSAATLEFLRADYAPRVYWGPLPQLEWIALAMSAAAAVWLVVAETQFRRSGSPERNLPLTPSLVRRGKKCYSGTVAWNLPTALRRAVRCACC